MVPPNYQKVFLTSWSLLLIVFLNLDSEDFKVRGDFGIYHLSKSLLFEMIKYFDLTNIFGSPINSEHYPQGMGARSSPVPTMRQRIGSRDKGQQRQRPFWTILHRRLRPPSSEMAQDRRELGTQGLGKARGTSLP